MIDAYYVVRFLKRERDLLGVYRWVCHDVGKLCTDNHVVTGRQYLNDFFGVDISCAFSTEEAMDMHIRFPISYPDNESAMEVLAAPFDRAGWICFWNPVDGINDPDNAFYLVGQEMAWNAPPPLLSDVSMGLEQVFQTQKRGGHK